MDLPPKRHFLHAAWLLFKHPITGEQMDLRSPLPEELKRSLAKAADDASLFAHSDPLEYFGYYRATG